jgi:hypothetical protein
VPHLGNAPRWSLQLLAGSSFPPKCEYKGDLCRADLFHQKELDEKLSLLQFGCGFCLEVCAYRDGKNSAILQIVSNIRVFSDSRRFFEETL